MKKTVLLFLLFFTSIAYSYSQELPNLKGIKLSKNAHFRAAEPLVLKVVDYLFETPIDKKNNARKEAGEFLVRWMNGTPDYIFVLEEKETAYFNTDADLTLMYVASLTKFMLEHKNEKDQKALILGSMQLALPYLNQQDNKKMWSKDLWQLNDANQKGKLAIFLNEQ